MTRTLAETHNHFSENALKEIFKVKAGKPSVIVSRENNRLEFRETFSLNACEVTGRSGSFLIDEALLPKISFIKEGHFVESKAAPALKLIGDVEVIDSHLIQPTRRVVKKTKGINLPDIVNAFLDQEDVPDAAEYISAICYQMTSLLPVYYFMIQGRLSVEDVIALIDSSKSTSQARRKLKERVSTAASRNKDQEPAQPGNLNATAADWRRRVSNRNLPDFPDEIELKHILTAILTLCRNEIDTKYLFPRLKTWFENSYSGMDTYAKSLFRRVLVHLDTVLYANSVSYGSTGGGTLESY